MVVANYDELKERVNKWLFIYLLTYLFIYLRRSSAYYTM